MVLATHKKKYYEIFLYHGSFTWNKIFETKRHLIHILLLCACWGGGGLLTGAVYQKLEKHSVAGPCTHTNEPQDFLIKPSS